MGGSPICARCGLRMTLRHSVRRGHPLSEYLQRRGIETAASACQLIPGTGLDEAVSPVVLEAVTPAARSRSTNGAVRCSRPYSSDPACRESRSFTLGSSLIASAAWVVTELLLQTVFAL